MRPEPTQIAQLEADLSRSIAHAAGWDAACDKAAADLALAMAESGGLRKEMRGRLCKLGLSRGAAAQLVRDAQRILRGRAWSGASPLCPHCLEPIGPQDHFCPHCHGPVTAHACIDPLGQVYASGWGYQHAVSGKPRLVVLVGMWLIFGPSMPWLFYALYNCLRAAGAFGPQDRWEYVVSYGPVVDFLRVAVVCAMIVLNAAILWRITKPCGRWVQRWKQNRFPRR
jgi:hypothetical protein